MILSNPGSGPVPEATHPGAVWNMAQLVVDVFNSGGVVTADWSQPGTKWTDDGRWTFRITVNGVEHDVDMPGLPIDRVRWLGPESGSIFAFPRLYVDGSSWIWKFAVVLLARENDE